jgi:hypothetical protein
MKIKHFLSGAVLWLFLLQGLYSQVLTTPEITVKDLKYDISYLASDELKGRYTGTPGSRAASDFIRDQFRVAGLKLLGEDGFQDFEVVVSVSAGPGNSFKYNGKQAVAGTDFTPFPFSKNETLSAGLVFAGYGFEIKQDSLAWNDYDGIDVTGKWVMILRGDPEMEKQESHYALYGDDRDKVLIARDKGAAGVIFVSGTKFDVKDDLVSMYFDKTQSTAGIPVIQVKRALADEILTADNLKIDTLESRLIADLKPHSAALKAKIDATTEVLQEKVIARNVVGLLEGSDPLLKNTYIVVGAHYDHLGMGGPGSGSRFLDSLAIHNGADDNASGVAGILELASYLATERPLIKRSIVFVAFDGEELGLLGSRYFVSNPLIDMKKVMAMVNFDMIGRLKTDKPAVMIGGTGTSAESESILNSLDTGSVRLTYSPEGYGASDHAAFYAENITVFFFTTGAHEDYHTPDDDWERINYDGEKEVLDIGRQLIIDLAERNEPLTFREAGPKQQEGRAGYRFKVTLGIMPDFTGSVQGGLGVGGVKKDGPAYKGGILKGDVITAIDGKQVNDIYDYMNRLKKLQPGQVISVDVLRNDQKVVLIIQL